MLELTQAAEFVKTMLPLFRQISACINSSHFQVAERALFLWNNDYIVNLAGPERYCSPRHVIPFNSSHEGRQSGG